MKSVFATLALITLAGCSNGSSNTNNGGTPPIGGGPGAPGGPVQQAPATVGFTAHAWCYVYPDQGQDVQDRFMFNDGGALNYQKFSAVNKQRGQLLGQADGNWSINGSVLNMDLNGQRFVFQIAYSVNDPVTRGERVHVYMNGQDVPYDPCN